MEGFHINRVGAIGPDPRKNKKEGKKKKQDKEGNAKNKEEKEDKKTKDSFDTSKQEEYSEPKLQSNPTIEWLKLNQIKKSNDLENN